MKSICVKCNREMDHTESGVVVAELFKYPASLELDNVYKFWYADLYECRDCYIQVVNGFADHPVWQHYMDKDEGIRLLGKCTISF